MPHSSSWPKTNTGYEDSQLIVFQIVGICIAEKRTNRENHGVSGAMREMNHRFVSTLELGALLGVTRQTVRNWIKKGEIKAFHIGQNLKIPVQEAVRILRFYELPVPDWLPQEKLATPQHSGNDRSVKDLSWSSQRTPDKVSPGKQEGLWEAGR